MKFLSLFTKTSPHKRFSYTPRYYDPGEEERQEREGRIRRELQREREKMDDSYRTRIAGSFRSSRKISVQRISASAGLLRLIILTFLTVWLIALFEFGTVAIYGLFLIVPVYFYLKFKNPKRD